ncbi:MAG TPA: lipid-A-disaccharide synthase [Verrucomicrobiae bacterium]|nr:lipid-A-disaccharide synthase [Verrucomicrobiae bacterium]
MNPKIFMLIAGEASGDTLAAELVSALRSQFSILNSLARRSEAETGPSSAVFFGAGGPEMAAAGVELAFDLTQYSVIGIEGVLKHYFKFRRLFNQLLALAIERKPEAVIGVDFGGFNLRFGHAIKQYVRDNPFSKWNPKIIQFVSPQVWASRPGRAKRLAADYDLVLSIFPFEKDWYAQRVPKLRVEYVGHPMIGRFASEGRVTRVPETDKLGTRVARPSEILLLPGSRVDELRRHLPVMLGALKLIREQSPAVKAKMILPNEGLKELANQLSGPPANFEFQIGDLSQALAGADLAIASTGTVTMECAFLGVPTVTLYKTSWFNWEIAKRLVTVKWGTMPNILANEEVYPEFIQNAATPENIARAGLDLLQKESRRQKIKSQLAKIVSSLGEPGASQRAAAAILSLL